MNDAMWVGSRGFAVEGHLCLVRDSSLLLRDALQLEFLYLRSHPTQNDTSQKIACAGTVARFF
jgi:hypothetical protein